MITLNHEMAQRPFSAHLGVVLAWGTLACGVALGAHQAHAHDIVAVGPKDGVERWLGPDAADDLGAGARIVIKVDRISVPATSMMVAEQRLAASGIPVHAHV